MKRLPHSNAISFFSLSQQTNACRPKVINMPPSHRPLVYILRPSPVRRASHAIIPPSSDSLVAPPLLLPYGDLCLRHNSRLAFQPRHRLSSRRPYRRPGLRGRSQTRRITTGYAVAVHIEGVVSAAAPCHRQLTPAEVGFITSRLSTFFHRQKSRNGSTNRPSTFSDSLSLNAEAAGRPHCFHYQFFVRRTHMVCPSRERPLFCR